MTPSSSAFRHARHGKENQHKSARRLYNLSVDKISAIIFPIVEVTDIFNKKT